MSLLSLVRQALNEAAIPSGGAFELLLSKIGAASASGPLFTLVPVNAAASPFTATASTTNEPVLMVDTTGGPVTVLLPAAPANGATVTVKDISGVITTTNQLTIDGNGKTIEGFATVDFLPGVVGPGTPQRKAFTLVFSAALNDWNIVWGFSGYQNGGTP